MGRAGLSPPAFLPMWSGAWMRPFRSTARLSAPFLSVSIVDNIIIWVPIAFFGIIVYFLWRMLTLMPRTKPTLIEPDSDSSVTWSDVAGVHEARSELEEVVEFLREPDRFAGLGARVPKGILLYGPPGTGKTLLAKAVANESGAAFYSQSASAFVEMFAGLGASRIRKLFETARKNQPAIVFIDELDAVGMKRSGTSFNREHDQTLNQLLVELDGFKGGPQVVVIGASTGSRISTRRCCAPAASTARSSCLLPTSLVASRSSGSTCVGSPPAKSTSKPSPARRRVSRAPTSPTSATRPRSALAARSVRSSSRLTSTTRSSVSSPASAAQGRLREGEAHPRLP